MSEEEKKAIENLKEVVDLYNDECLITTDYDFKSIEIILNLIEKQQKEIEELKNKNNLMNAKIHNLLDDNMELLRKDGNTDKLNYKYIECPKVEAEWYKSERYINENYISKDKIKAKIEELEQDEDFYREQDRIYEYEGKLNLLQSLLEEE